MARPPRPDRPAPGGQPPAASGQSLWRRVAATVTPLDPAAPPPLPIAPAALVPLPPVPAPAPTYAPQSRARPRRAAADLARAGLDSHWERRLRKGQVEPDIALDLHGHTLASAHAALDAALARAAARGARVLLVVAGRARPGPHHPDPADGRRPRGAIRAMLPGWLADGPHADRVAATRPAHASHGGAGAIYVILRRNGEG